MSRDSSPPTVETPRVKDLHFDYENPRLIEFGITEDTEEEEILAHFGGKWTSAS